MKTRQVLALPSKNGVSPSCVALPCGPWTTLLDFMQQRFPMVTRDDWGVRMRRGDVVDAQGNWLLPHSLYRPQTKVYYYRSLPPEPPIPFEESVLYQDEYIVAADKPHFLPVVPSGRYLQETLLVRLKRKLGIDTLTPMHRIDRETAGVVLFTVQPHTRHRYQALFREREVVKYYEAIAPLHSERAFPLVHRSRLVDAGPIMTMHEVPGEPNAETRIELLVPQGKLARYGLHPLTGQKHQLRVQMNALGMPILNDRIYPKLLPEIVDPAGLEEQYRSPLQLLAKSITFQDPITGERRHFESRRSLQF